MPSTFWSATSCCLADRASNCFIGCTRSCRSFVCIFISGYTDCAMFDETILERDLAFLEKPFSAEGLVAKIRDVLNQ